MNEQLITDNLGLVPFFIRRMRMFGEFDDLEQAGRIGLMQAAEKYDDSQGFTFSTYASAWIRNAIRRESDRLKSPGIPTKHFLAERLQQVTIQGLEGKLQRSPTRDEIAEVVGYEIADVRIDGTLSLDKNPFGDLGVEPTFEADWLAVEDPVANFFEDIEQLDYLDPEDKALLVAHGMGYSLIEIGEAMGLHRQTISVRIKALKVRLQEEL